MKGEGYSGHIYIKANADGHWNGYMASVPRPKGGKPVNKLFSLSLYGRNCLAAAIRWRDQQYANLHGKPIPPAERYVHEVPQKRSRTKIVGVNRYFRTARHRINGRFYEYRVEVFCAKHPDGKGRREFSIRKYGVSGAKLLASMVRRKWVQEHLGYA